jgi:hypothetical protein
VQHGYNQPFIIETKKKPTCKIPKYLLSDRFFERIQSIQNHETLPFLSGKLKQNYKYQMAALD